MRAISKILTLILIFLAFSCGSKKRVADSNKQDPREQRVVTRENRSTNGTQQPAANRSYSDKILDYINLYAPIAQEEMALYKIPASITLAQGILESGAGEGTLTRTANNHFGIKCHGWQGASVYHDDDRSQECFRKYNDAKYSFRDHSLFLTERKRYAALFDLDINDYKGWARGLRAAGYATDRKYPDKLISLIERYQLYKYDGGTGQELMAYNESSSMVQQYVVKKGDTLYSISKKFGLSVDQLKQFNNIRGTAIGIGQVLKVSP